MPNKTKSIAFIIATLFIGTMIYLLFRPPLSWLPSIKGWDKAIIDISWLPLPISGFILYHFSDVLWALAFAETLYVIKNNLYIAVLISLVSTAVFETLQYFGVARGTGDIWDFIFVAISLSIYFVIKKGVNKNEKSA
jgi:hypothetical protein